jgi:predicted dithiol-disulfide oxidoreductase (DUF899 family)
MNATGTELAGEIERLEEYLIVQSERLAEMKRQLPRKEVSEYTLQGLRGPVKLSALFGSKNDLIVIHNMGKGCRYCTLWADGFNGVWEHVANRAGFLLVSPDPPDVMRQFAASRGWKFPIASGHGSTFIEDMGFRGERNFRPGVSTFQKEADGRLWRIARSSFGPFDSFCSVWHLMALLADGVNDWEPKYQY